MYLILEIKMTFNHRVLKNNAIIQLMKQPTYPSCVTCKHYIPHIPDSLVGIFENHDKTPFSKCKLFGYKERGSGLIVNCYTSICRESDNMCGKEGYFYKLKPNPKPILNNPKTND